MRYDFDFLKAFNSPFKRPKLVWYIGKVALGTPIFFPRKWVKPTHEMAMKEARKEIARRENSNKYNPNSKFKHTIPMYKTTPFIKCQTNAFCFSQDIWYGFFLYFLWLFNNIIILTNNNVKKISFELKHFKLLNIVKIIFKKLIEYVRWINTFKSILIYININKI